jgi:hypothetical protein
MTMMPGFDFLQGLMKNAGTGLPGMAQWIAPTLDPDELEKRIGELRTVQFWLEQNARMLAATVQTLEVQRLTLSTLKTMNLPLADISESLRIKLPDPPIPAPSPTFAAPTTAPIHAAPVSRPEPEPSTPSAPAAAAVDPMAWWGALTQQFTELAANAMKDVRADAAVAAVRSASAGSAAPAAPVARSAAAKKVAGKAAARKPAARKAPRTAGG